MAIDWYVLAQSHGYSLPSGLLIDMYETEGHSIAYIAETLGVSTWAVTSALHRFNVPIRQQGGNRGEHRD
jgi:transposase